LTVGMVWTGPPGGAALTTPIAHNETSNNPPAFSALFKLI
jgi:hypothetical protein